MVKKLGRLGDSVVKLLKHEERCYMARDIGLMMLREAFIEARACRDVAFEEIVRNPWLAKGKTRETMDNYFDLKSRNAIEHVDAVIKEIKKKAVDRQRKFEAEIDKEL